MTRRARLWVQLTDYSNFSRPATGFPLVLEPGATSATVPVTYTADLAYNPLPQLTQITLLAPKTSRQFQQSRFRSSASCSASSLRQVCARRR